MSINFLPLVLVALVSITANADQWDDGLTAYEQGNYIEAFNTGEHVR
jgi:hypothetical protein